MVASDVPVVRQVVADEEGSGPAVVMLHGQPGHAATWRAVASRVAAHRRVLVPDRPGYGRTGGPAGDFRANARAVVELLDRRGVPSAVVAGHSWAGGIALEMALTYPSRVDGVVLVASIGGPGSVDTVDRMLRLPVLGSGLALGAIVALRLDPARRVLAGLIGDPAGLVHDEAQGWWSTWRSFVLEQRVLVDDLGDVRRRLGRLATPATVVIGCQDRLIPPRSQESLAQALPGAAVVRVEGAGHLLLHEAPEAVADAILAAGERG